MTDNDNRDIDGIIYNGILPEAGTFSPRETGPLAQSARSYPVTFVEYPRGIHRLLCRVGLHAWHRRVVGIPALLRSAPETCAVCGVNRG